MTELDRIYEELGREQRAHSKARYERIKGRKRGAPGDDAQRMQLLTEYTHLPQISNEYE